MREWFSWRLFASVAVGLLVVGTGVGAYLAVALRADYWQRIEQDLVRTARALAQVWGGTRHREPGDWDAAVDAVGRSIGLRVTVIDDAGTVLGDSMVPTAQLPRVESHATRPEVVAARRTGLGRAVRLSNTVGRELMYVAVRMEDGGFLRVAHPFGEIRSMMRHLYSTLAVGGLVLFLLSLVLAAAVSRQYRRVLDDVTRYAERLASGEKGGGHLDSPPEFAGLTKTVETLAGRMRRSVRGLSAERDRFAAVLDSMAEGVVSLDEHQKVVLLNRAATDLLRIDSEWKDRDLVEVVRSAELMDMLAGLAPGERAAGQLDMAATGKTLLVSAQRQQSGGYVVVFSDVTELRRLEQVRRDFVANVSHELRTPISVVAANAETLLDGALEDPEVARRFVASIHANAQRLANLVSDLLDIARIEEGAVHLTFGAVSLEPLVQRVVETHRRAAADRGHRVSVRLEHTAAPRGDAQAVEQVLSNLVENAVKYIGDNGHIQVRSEDGDGVVRLVVQDDGPGIPAPLRQRVFERFFRVDKGRSRAMGGTGLGLSIVRNLVQAMGGAVRLEAAEPTGCVFVVELPRFTG